MFDGSGIAVTPPELAMCECRMLDKRGPVEVMGLVLVMMGG